MRPSPPSDRALKSLVLIQQSLGDADRDDSSRVLHGERIAPTTRALVIRDYARAADALAIDGRRRRPSLPILSCAPTWDRHDWPSTPPRRNSRNCESPFKRSMTKAIPSCAPRSLSKEPSPRRVIRQHESLTFFSERTRGRRAVKSPRLSFVFREVDQKRARDSLLRGEAPPLRASPLRKQSTNDLTPIVFLRRGARNIGRSRGARAGGLARTSDRADRSLRWMWQSCGASTPCWMPPSRPCATRARIRPVRGRAGRDPREGAGALSRSPMSDSAITTSGTGDRRSRRSPLSTEKRLELLQRLDRRRCRSPRPRMARACADLHVASRRACLGARLDARIRRAQRRSHRLRAEAFVELGMAQVGYLPESDARILALEYERPHRRSRENESIEPRYHRRLLSAILATPTLTYTAAQTRSIRLFRTAGYSRWPSTRCARLAEADPAGWVVARTGWGCTHRRRGCALELVPHVRSEAGRPASSRTHGRQLVEMGRGGSPPARAPAPSFAPAPEEALSSRRTGGGARLIESFLDDGTSLLIAKTHASRSPKPGSAPPMAISSTCIRQSDRRDAPFGPGGTSTSR